MRAVRAELALLAALPPSPFRAFASYDARPIAPPDSCYRLASGAMVHVKPECRCPR